jgi:hypothetical protein
MIQIMTMLRYTALCLCLNLYLAAPAIAQDEKLPVVYLDAQEVIDIAKTSGKPYLLLAMYIPKCKQADRLFSERVAYYRANKDKINLAMVSVLKSRDNIDIVAQYAKTYDYETPFYVLDTMYAKNNVMETHIEFMKDLHQLTGEKHKFFQYVLIDNKGRIIYQDEDGDLDKLNKYIR